MSDVSVVDRMRHHQVYLQRRRRNVAESEKASVQTVLGVQEHPGAIRDDNVALFGVALRPLAENVGTRAQIADSSRQHGAVVIIVAKRELN